MGKKKGGASLEIGAPETRINDSRESVLTPRDEISVPRYLDKKSLPTPILLSNRALVKRKLSAES